MQKKNLSDPTTKAYTQQNWKTWMNGQSSRQIPGTKVKSGSG
jgi:predicted secreted acid phosphatase